MNLLPAETKLDIFKCLDFNQLNNFQLSNRHFCELIAKYNKELAIKVFYSVELVVWKNYVCKDLEYSRKELDLNLSEENKLKWKAAIQERIPFYFYHNNNSLHKNFDVAIDDYKLNEIANLFIVSKGEEGKSPKFLQLQLKRYPETIEEMLVLGYWLKKLSYCFIENFKFEQGFINPDILDLFFGDYPLKFYTKYFYLYNKGGYCFPKGLEFMYHHVVIRGCKGLHYEDSDRKMFGEMVKDEERYFQRFSLEEEERKEFCKVVEYELFEVDNPLEDAMLYLCFRIGSKKAFYYETVGTFV
uniref:Uncharacterized protein n=1 Tax=Meloidogyne enterolobii TaxID=390850 RepID=A0A6V7WC55_MELEN|nr:unnamed protein product [Meloidogyne enterolobii]